jgi:hypothetical protein
MELPEWRREQPRMPVVFGNPIALVGLVRTSPGENTTDRLALMRGPEGETFTGILRLFSCGEIALKKTDKKRNTVY